MNPWAGLASYEDPETAERKLKFCGRDDDSYDVAKLIMGNVFVTLYGKSGIGKTSLLNAGVFPELREEAFTPISLRIGMRDEETPSSYQTMIVEAIERTIGRIETIDVVPEQDNQQAKDFLWNYFARHRFYDKHDELTTPVIVFDQFEVIFRADHKESDALLRQLDYINDKDHALDNCIINELPYHYDTNYRFVVSIREDDLYRLEDSIDNCYLPALKRCRYRLRGLTEQGARDVILIPGEGLYKPEEQDAIVKKIIDKSRNEDGSISTNIVSLLCSRIFSDFQQSGADHISTSLIESFMKGNPFEQFYNEATKGFSNRDKAYMEDHLVDSTGRRNSIPESDFLLHVKNGAYLLEGPNKILQRTSTGSDAGSHRIELIHDSFCDSLAASAKKRERRKRQKWAATIVGIMIMYVVLGIFVARLESKLNKREKEIERKELEIKLWEEDYDNLQESYNNMEGKLNNLEDTITHKFRLDVTYTIDGIEYEHGIPTPSQLNEWKDKNEEKCNRKIQTILDNESYNVPSDMIKDEPCLVYLILTSQSIESEGEKQSWFDLWSLMTEDQIRKLYFILYNETYQLAVIRFQDEVKLLNQESYDLAKDGNYRRALSTIDDAIDKARIGYASMYDSKGEILLMKDDTSEAVKMWKKIMDIAPDFLDYYGSTPFYEQLRDKGLIGN